MLGREYMLKKLLAEPPKHDTHFLPYATQLQDILDRGVNLGIDPFKKENDWLKAGNLKCTWENNRLREDWEAKGRPGKCPTYTPTVQLEYSMRAKSKDAYKTWGKNTQKG